MTWVTVWPTEGEWSDGMRVRLGPDKTLAVWHVESTKHRQRYTLTHVLPDGRSIGPVISHKANDARKAMRGIRTKMGIKTPQ